MVQPLAPPQRPLHVVGRLGGLLYFYWDTQRELLRVEKRFQPHSSFSTFGCNIIMTHSVNVPCHFFFCLFTSYYGLLLQKPCQGIKFSEKSVIQSVTDTPTVNQTVIVKEYIDERDIGLLLIPSGVQHSTFYSSIARYLQ